MEKKTIRTIQFIDSYFPVTDGVVQTVHQYASIMHRDGFACVVAPRSPLAFDDTVLPYPVFRSMVAPVNFKEYVLPTPNADRKLKAYLRQTAPELFHVHTPFTIGHLAVTQAKKLGVPCVATFHSKYYDDVVRFTGSRVIARTVTDAIVALYNRMDSVWACSESTAETLRSYGFKGEIFVMDNGSSLLLPPEQWDALRQRTAAEFRLAQSKRTLLFVGHLIWHKNLRLILDTLRLLWDQGEEYRLLIVGNGYDEAEIRTYADSLRFPQGAVRFLGKIDDRELLAGVYLNADLFFFPSVYDNSPLVVREAASLSLPSLLAKGSNAAEVICPDHTGFIAENSVKAMAREIGRIFDTPGLLETVSQGARQQIPKSWESIVELVQEKYREILEQYHAR